jgi:clan AA aspartic protease
MGEIRVRARLSNVIDPSRSVTAEMLVDTGAMLVNLPSSLVHRLGLRKVGEAQVEYADGRRARRPIVGPLKVAIDGRVTHLDALSEPARSEPLLGVVALETLDLVPNPTTRRLEPRHRGKLPVMDLK